MRTTRAHTPVIPEGVPVLVVTAVFVCEQHVEVVKEHWRALGRNLDKVPCPHCTKKTCHDELTAVASNFQSPSFEAGYIERVGSRGRGWVAFDPDWCTRR